MTPDTLTHGANYHPKTDDPKVRHTTALKRAKYAPDVQIEHISCRISCHPRRIIRKHRTRTPHEHTRRHTTRGQHGHTERRLAHNPNKRPAPQHPNRNEPTAPAVVRSPKTPAPKSQQYHERGSSPPASAEPARTAVPPAPHYPHDAPQPPHRAGLL